MFPVRDHDFFSRFCERPGDVFRRSVPGFETSILRLSVFFRVKFLKTIFFIALPFTVFYWVAPFLSRNTIGIDYYRHSLGEQFEMLFSIRNGSFPLFIPGYWGGVSSSALTLGQVFHPLSHISSLMPGYWKGYALEWNTFFRFLSLGLVHLFAYDTLRRLDVSKVLSFAISFSCLYNFSTVFLLRFGASMDNFLALFLSFCIILRLWKRPDSVSYHIFLIFAVYLMICGGHPKVTYFGVLFILTAALITPFFTESVSPGTFEGRTRKKVFYKKVISCISSGIILSSAYTLPFVGDFLMDNTDRMGIVETETISEDKLAFLVEGADTFFSPLRGKYRLPFGGSFLFAIIPFFPAGYIFGIRIPRKVIALWGVLIFLALVSIGPLSPLYRYFQEYFPLARGLRGSVWAGILIPCFAFFVMIRAARTDVGFLGKSLSLCSAVCLILVPFITVYHFVTKNIVIPREFWDVTAIRATDRAEVLFLAVSVMGLSALFFYGFCKKTGKIWGALFCVLLVAQSSFALKQGVISYPQPYKRTMMSLEFEKEKKLSFMDMEGNGMASGAVSLHRANGGVFSAQKAKLYSGYVFADTVERSYEIMRSEDKGSFAVVVGRQGDEGHISRKANPDLSGKISLSYSSFNRVIFDVISDTEALFVLNYPFTGRWKARVDGKEKEVYRSNGMKNGVFIGPGRSVVDFRYVSLLSEFGMALSCAALFIIILYWSEKEPVKKRKTLYRISGMILCAAAFFIWHAGLYSGKDLGTAYVWETGAYLNKDEIDTAWRADKRLWGDRLSDRTEVNLMDAF